ncbi:MAG: SAM domain-containing protein [Candidatus Competibacteraceae bacterium]
MPITTPDELRHWLAGLKQEHLVDTFIAGGWLGDKLLTLTREDLADLAVPREQRGDLMLAVEALRQGEGPLTLPDEHAPSYAPQFTPAVIDQCRVLGRQPPQPWVDAVAESWPGPIAHEYHRLRELLTEGHIVPAIFQLKDLVEVLIKFPALVMARDLLQHGDEEASRDARRALFGERLSLGTWLAGVRDKIAPQVRRLAPGGPLLLPELGSVFATTQQRGKDAPPPWCETLARLVNWRNDQLGHGAFRLDPAEYLDELRDHLAAINQALAAQRDLWNGVKLRGDAPHGPDLTGWRAIRHWHAGGAGEHRNQQAPVLLERGERALHLGPLVTLRRCAVCNKQDVFLYDSLAGRSLDDGFKLLDYLTGHRLGLPIHRAEELRVAAGDPPTTVPAPAAGELDEDYGEAALNELLETKLLEARYLRPEYLREPFRHFVEARDRGVFWLTAPSHTGKSVFVHALAAPAEVGEKPLLARTAVAALHIRREFKTWPEQLRYFLLEDVLHRAFGREPARLRLPELDVRAEQPAEAFAALLHATMRLKPPHLERLVICLDGLDELPPSPAGEAGIADFLPRPEALPEGCFLLLTSRPLAECPPHVRAALADRFAAGDEFTAFALTLDAPGTSANAAGDAYRQLLRAYFDRELRTRQRVELHQALAAFIAGRDTVECRNDLGTLRPPALAEFAKQEWAELTPPRQVRVRSPAGAPSLAETVAQPLLAHFDDAFDAVLDKANERFLYLAHLTDLLRDEQLRFEDIAALPSGAGLYQHYLSQLQRQLAPDAETAEKLASKPWDFARRVIVTLAAIEQAHVAYQEMLPLSVREEVFRGVPLDILAALLDESRRSVRLVFTLYTLKSILAVWKGEDARDARYALGLKDFVATVRALWPEALADRHRFLAGQMLESLEERWETVTDDDRLDAWRLRYVLAHADLGGDPELARRLNEEEAVYLCFYRLGERTHERARYAVTVAHWSLYLTLLERRAQRQETDEARNDLARAHQNRGVTRGAGGDLAGALADYDRAIELREGLRTRLEARGEWPPAWANDLAGAHQNRGNARGDGGDRAGARADYDRAIELMEGLRTRLEARGEWPPAWANDLAMAYMNRGIARKQVGDLVEAIEDWGAAATIYLQRVQKGWLPAGADLLKAIYWVLGGCRDLADWPSAAQRLLAFIEFYQQLETLWAEQHGDAEPPWREIVGQFAGAVHGLNPDQRAALLAALGEKAEAVKQAFGWT